MRYLCIGYHDTGVWDTMPPNDRRALLDEVAAYDDLLRRGGHLIGRHEHGPTQTEATTTLRFANGRVSIADGSSAGATNFPADVFVIDAVDLNHAIQLLSQLPGMRPGGSMEIRPIDENDTIEDM